MVELPSDRPAVMGILNVTPDSFSDGGSFFEPERAVARGLELVAEGADFVDVGGESTRPRADSVSLEEELRRVLPVVRELVSAGIKVSIDTSKPTVAEECLKVGASVVNDVTGLRDPKMRELCAEYQCQVCIMHMQGDPRTMQVNPQYLDVVGDVLEFLTSKIDGARTAGIKSKNIWIDPGIGFGKTVEHNLALIKYIDVFVNTGFPVLLGMSRKSFLGALCDSDSLGARLNGALALQTFAQLNGVKVIRTHDCAQTLNAIRAIQSLKS